MTYQKLSDTELSEISGGLAPLIVFGTVGLFVLQYGWSHTDQIVKGIKKGWR
ncbi:conserved hypothetical protein,(Bacteriocin-type signal sequence) [Pseudolactococcus piscium]|uniref:bacteriocin n=1 Tax=Pseudolactococcus carnosus TaxID=2749961 RepID=UPI000811FCAF|nr:bacteriocin [Lactococcus carnosus]MCJ2002239.1 bacteriocin [Lactococcus carnosus]SCA91503.1 conserved hypothetical protein,(Bacteriocin-type signal sequence) [Lactococcus piscium]